MLLLYCNSRASFHLSYESLVISIHTGSSVGQSLTLHKNGSRTNDKLFGIDGTQVYFKISKQISSIDTNAN